ncbi:MAG: DNA alkylation repair protein [bacterium]|nr:DNA alkylation repair protein [bacterium]
MVWLRLRRAKKSCGKRPLKAAEIRRWTLFALQKEDFQKRLVEEVNYLFQSKTPFALLRIVGEEIGKKGLVEPDKWLAFLESLFTEDGKYSYNAKELRETEKKRKGLIYGAWGVIISFALKVMGQQYPQRVVESAGRYILETQYWSAVDAVGYYAFRDIFDEDTDCILGILKDWACSRNKWLRRAATYGITSFLLKQGRDIEKAAAVLDILMEDGDRDVKKGVGIALRHMTKHYKANLIEFVNRWKETDDRHTRWIIKDGIRKLDLQEQKEIMAEWR